MVVHAFIPSAWEEKGSKPLWFQGQPDLRMKLQGS